MIKKKVKSFTLIEIVVALAISSIVLAIAYSCYNIVGNNFIQQKEKNSRIHNFHLLHSLLMHDFNKSQLVERKNETTLSLYFAENMITYQFEDGLYVLRKFDNLRADTFPINYDEVSINTLVGNIKNTKVVNAIKVQSTLYQKPITLNVEKQYAADFYLKNENEY